MQRAMVYLVGAGPGDPGLLTVRGRDCLGQADFVLYDQLVAPRILDLARPEAERVCVTALGGTHPERCPHIHERLIAEARLGKCVVRLKGGDPQIFGRGGEEAEALRAANIPYEIVPGVTAALGAAAYLEIPLTHRDQASAVAFVTGHEDPTKPAARIDWQALAKFPGTVVVYMGIARLRTIADELMNHGKRGDTPAVAVHKASTNAQRSVSATLATIDEAVRTARLSAPALIIIGPVAATKPVMSWFESKPLLGKRILVTRPRQQSGPMIARLEELGANAVSLPVIDLLPPHDWSQVDAALDDLRAGSFAWLIFTSANGVQFFCDRLFARGRDVRDLGSVKLAAIGSATADALRGYHLNADVAPVERMNSEQLAESLVEKVRGQRVLLAVADRARDILPKQLADVCQVQQVATYCQVEVVDRNSAAFDSLRRGEIDAVTFTSPNIVRAFLAGCDEIIVAQLASGAITCVTNSPRATEALRQANISATREAANPTGEAVIESLIQLYARNE